MAAVFLASGCSGGSDDDALPAECGDGSDQEKAQSEECAEAQFDRDVTAAEDEEIQELSPERRLELARQLCARAQDITESGGARPVRAVFVADVAEEWDLSPAAAEVVASSAEPLCPEQFELLESLPMTNGPVRLELAVEGNGRVVVEYTGSDGLAAEESTFAPWTLPVLLQAPAEVVLRVTPDPDGRGGKLKCAIRLDGEVLMESDQRDGDDVVCRLSKDELIAAANGAEQ